jgi:endonuclease YncB( thermonuclease family)
MENKDEDLIQKLEALTNKTKMFSIDGLITYAKCVKVYDGDTCHCVFFFHDVAIKFSVRLLGIDTPELKTGSHREEAKIARDALVELILNKIVKLHCHGWDKYGRLLGDIETMDGINVSAYMLERGYAVRYDGGKKNITP